MSSDPAVRWRAPAVGAVAVLAVLVLALQATRGRPYQWPAGPGFTLEGPLAGGFAEPARLRAARPPALDAGGHALVVVDVRPGGPAARAGLAPGDRVHRIRDAAGRELVARDEAARDPAAPLRAWRAAYWLDRTRPLALTVVPAAGGPAREAIVVPEPAWALPADARDAWLASHAGPLAQMTAFTLGALVILALGARGATAQLVTLAMIGTAAGNGGALAGAERALSAVAAEVVLAFGWLAIPLAFPVIGLAVLYFPARAPVLDRHRWIAPALLALAAPMAAEGALAALTLLGADAATRGLAWLSVRPWLYDLSFVLALAANVGIVIEGIGRYRRTLDPTERRRIEMVVFTGVPAVFAYALKEGLPLLGRLAGWPLAFPLPAAALLQAVVLLPAFGLPYAVAVRHVFSPRTVLRRGLQYALARRTLSVVTVLPAAALIASLAANRDRPLAEVVLGQPLFYTLTLGLLAVGVRYRDRAQRWLDRRFFRAEYDAREILLSLASRVPFESDPRALVALVLTRVDRALQPESAAVLAAVAGGDLEPLASLRHEAGPLPRSGGLATLLAWSHEPLALFLDDERSAAARLPAADRAWLERSRTTLLVPILGGSSGVPSLAGAIALGQKRSEEPYTAEDRQLLAAIAAQMGLVLDLSHLRRRVTDSAGAAAESAPTVLASSGGRTTAALGCCPACGRCLDLAAGACPDDGAGLAPVVGLPPIVEGKYRVDALVGRGGMGSVFRARDMRLDRDVAIKVVRAELLGSAEARARFRREAQVVARLQHPAVVAVFDYGTLPDGAAYLVMEFVRGEDLRRLLRRERCLPFDRLVPIVRDVAAGVQAAHDAGVLHRDLKPENVLLPASGAGPKVLDFGVAKVTDAPAGSTLTGAATIVGTPAYMAPEQLRGDTVDGRADVFSLGVISFEALTGGLPYGAGSLVDVSLQQATAPLGAEALPAAAAPVVLSAIALDPAARPPTPAALAAALERVLRA